MICDSGGEMPGPGALSSPAGPSRSPAAARAGVKPSPPAARISVEYGLKKLFQGRRQCFDASPETQPLGVVRQRPPQGSLQCMKLGTIATKLPLNPNICTCSSRFALPKAI